MLSDQTDWCNPRGHSALSIVRYLCFVNMWNKLALGQVMNVFPVECLSAAERVKNSSTDQPHGNSYKPDHQSSYCLLPFILRDMAPGEADMQLPNQDFLERYIFSLSVPHLPFASLLLQLQPSQTYSTHTRTKPSRLPYKPIDGGGGTIPSGNQ